MKICSRSPKKVETVSLLSPAETRTRSAWVNPEGLVGAMWSESEHVTTSPVAIRAPGAPAGLPVTSPGPQVGIQGEGPPGAQAGTLPQGKCGDHSAHLEPLLAEMQSLARQHPGATW